METPSKNLDFWFKQLEDSDPNKRIQAIEKLIVMRHPKIVDILIEVAETDKSEKARVMAIRALGKIEMSNPSETFAILKNLLIGENPKIRKAVLRTIVDLGDISAIKYLTKYFYSDHSIGIKIDVGKALADLSKVLDESKKDDKSKKLNKAMVQEKLSLKPSKKENDIDYKKHIKKY